MSKLLQKTYHQLEEWIIMLNSPAWKDTDAGTVREEMIEHCNYIWNNLEEKNDIQN